MNNDITQSITYARHNSPQRLPSNLNNNMVQTTVQTQHQAVKSVACTTLLRPPYTHAQSSTLQHPLFTINTIHTNPQVQPITSRSLS